MEDGEEALERMAAVGASALDLRHLMVLVASEPIAAGAEIRVDYESGSASYWQGRTPLEPEWRNQRVEPPPPSGEPPTSVLTRDFSSEMLRAPPIPWPYFSQI